MLEHLARASDDVTVYGDVCASMGGAGKARGIFAELLVTSRWARRWDPSSVTGLISVVDAPELTSPLTDDETEIRAHATLMQLLRNPTKPPWISGRWPGTVHPAWAKHKGSAWRAGWSANVPVMPAPWHAPATLHAFE